MLLSEAIRDFLATNAGPSISFDAWKPVGGNHADDWQISLNGGTPEEREELTKLVNVFVMGWRMCRQAQDDERCSAEHHPAALSA